MKLLAEEIQKRVAPPVAVTVEPCVTSTNTVLREAAEQGVPEWTVLVAEKQTAGRGRCGHTFWSPEGTGLYLSVLLRPLLTPEQAAYLLTPLAAVAAARAVEAVSERTAAVKWVNDIYCDNKKVCGILAEARTDAQTGRLQYEVIGAGFNVWAPREGFPAELDNRAGAVLLQAEELARERLAAAFLNELQALYSSLPHNHVYEEYRERCFRLGREITVLKNGEEQPATVEDITEKYALRVRLADGRLCDLNAGEISVRPCRL